MGDLWDKFKTRVKKEMTIPPADTVDELIVKLMEVSNQGYGGAKVEFMAFTMGDYYPHNVKVVRPPDQYSKYVRLY
jgi:hypothetical protein